jgi:hypothetical protein
LPLLMISIGSPFYINLKIHQVCLKSKEKKKIAQQNLCRGCN